MTVERQGGNPDVSREAFKARVMQARKALKEPGDSVSVEGSDGGRVIVIRTDSPLIMDFTRAGNDGAPVDFMTVMPPEQATVED